MSNKTTDKSVVKCLGFCGFGMGSNITEVDVKDGRVARIRPLHYDQLYTPEELNAWKIEARGHVLEPGMKSYPPPLSVAYKTRTYSPNRIPYPLKRVDWDPNGERNTAEPRLVASTCTSVGTRHATSSPPRSSASRRRPARSPSWRSPTATVRRRTSMPPTAARRTC